MKVWNFRWVLGSLLFLLAVINILCSPRQEVKKTDEPVYLNHHDTVKYVGMNTCLTCHTDKKTFLETGMGKSFHTALSANSSANFNHKVVWDTLNNLYYVAFKKNEEIYLREFRLEGRDTIYKNEVKLDYIVGSGHHTNSHIVNTNGYLTQAPLTFYTQKKMWDLPPGFEHGMNTRFDRKIGLECMSCHNAYPEFVKGSENKYTYVPGGIDCERCHGPGQAHVNQFANGIRVDTSVAVDYSIVNPAKLPVDLQFDICQRCHLQGNTVLEEGKSFYSFKPGQELSKTLTTFLPKYEGRDDEFIMASHADRLRMSKCFIASSNKKDNKPSLRPYKDALTCVTCHNPHVSVRQTGNSVFNSKCQSCHKNAVHKEKGNLNDCVKCHMPSSGSIDIPHVSIHDHYIRVPVSKKEINAIRKFVGLRPVNVKNPSSLVVAKAYINQYEKFDNNPALLDSALNYLRRFDVKKDLPVCIESLRVFFLKGEYSKVVTLATQFEGSLLARLKQVSEDNGHAWACYRVGESLVKTGQDKEAYAYYQRACELAQHVVEFRLKLANTLARMNKIPEAEKMYLEIISSNPASVQAYTNLGFVRLNQGKVDEAEQFYGEALKLDPDNEQALLNMIGLYIYERDFKKARIWLKRAEKKYPDNARLKEIRNFINSNT